MSKKHLFTSLTFILLLICDNFLSLVHADSKHESTNKHTARKNVEEDDDEEEPAYDPDEFDGIEKLNTKILPEEKPRKFEKVVKTTTISEPENDYSIGLLISKFWMEALVTIFLIAYGVNFFTGKKKNTIVVESWAKKYKELFDQNFSLVGVDDKGHMILKESSSIFKCYCSGRINCESLTSTIDLQKRHDLVFYAIDLFMGGKDTLTMDIEMNDTDMEPFVFAVVPKREEKQLRKDVKDLNMFTQNFTSEIQGFPKKLVILSELEEIVPAIITKEVLTTLEKYEQYFIKMHFTDQNPYSTKSKKKLLRFVYALPPENDLEQLSTLMKMTIYFIDQIPKLYFSVQSKKTIEKNRILAQERLLKETHAARQEAAQQRKIEKKQKEDGQKGQVLLTKDEIKRLEEKERKKELKKKQSKFKVVVG